MLGSPVKDQVQRRHLGLPPRWWIWPVAEGLWPGDRQPHPGVADGVDFSAEALRRVRELAAQNGK